MNDIWKNWIYFKSSWISSLFHDTLFMNVWRPLLSLDFRNLCTKINIPFKVHFPRYFWIILVFPVHDGSSTVTPPTTTITVFAVSNSGKTDSIKLRFLLTHGCSWRWLWVSSQRHFSKRWRAQWCSWNFVQKSSLLPYETTYLLEPSEASRHHCSPCLQLCGARTRQHILLWVSHLCKSVGS